MAQITEDYVSFNTAKLLKEKGFDWEVHRSYLVNDNVFIPGDINDIPLRKDAIRIPTLQMAMKWLREEKDVQIEIPIVGTDTWESPTKWMYGFRCQTKDVIDRRNADFSSYEEACETAIRYCLENLI